MLNFISVKYFRTFFRDEINFTTKNCDLRYFQGCIHGGVLAVWYEIHSLSSTYPEVDKNCRKGFSRLMSLWFSTPSGLLMPPSIWLVCFPPSPLPPPWDVMMVGVVILIGVISSELSFRKPPDCPMDLTVLPLELPSPDTAAPDGEAKGTLHTQSIQCSL